MTVRFAERVALVTGAAGGTGAAVARRPVSEGATVHLFDREHQVSAVARTPTVDGGPR
jgi:NAD(P)-dependent dehydrogenase (short-subunit alcohol dehydrogenase family)